MITERGIQDAAIDELRVRLAQHLLYADLDDLSKLRLFMEHHVFAVWDFMSLLKSLQRDLTCTTIPWIPRPDSEAARLINEVVLGEESDARREGTGYASHFELYLEAMKEVGADRGPILRLLDHLANGLSMENGLAEIRAPEAAKLFVSATFEIVEHGQPHTRASALLYGREQLIPPMFKSIVRQLHETSRRCTGLLYYLERHIEVDENDHSVKAERLLARLCGSDPQMWEDARRAAHVALRARLQLWDSILESITTVFHQASSFPLPQS